MRRFRKTLLLFLLVFLGFSIGFPILQIFWFTLHFGDPMYPSDDYIMKVFDILGFLANWPSGLMGTLPSEAYKDGHINYDYLSFFYGASFLSNIIGWMPLGLILGLIVGFAATRKNRR